MQYLRYVSLITEQAGCVVGGFLCSNFKKGVDFMPRTKGQRALFALLTVLVTVHAYVFYSLYVINGSTFIDNAQFLDPSIKPCDSGHRRSRRRAGAGTWSARLGSDSYRVLPGLCAGNAGRAAPILQAGL